MCTGVYAVIVNQTCTLLTLGSSSSEQNRTQYQVCRHHDLHNRWNGSFARECENIIPRNSVGGVANYYSGSDVMGGANVALISDNSDAVNVPRNKMTVSDSLQLVLLLVHTLLGKLCREAT